MTAPAKPDNHLPLCYRSAFLAFLKKDAPILDGYLDDRRKEFSWRVWCDYCKVWHCHGAGTRDEDLGFVDRYIGHRTAHCVGDSPYKKTGYSIFPKGYWTKDLTPAQRRWGPTGRKQRTEQGG